VKDMFYAELQRAFDSIPAGASVTVGMDANAQVGPEIGVGRRLAVGLHGRDTRNDNGNRLVQFALANGMNITNTRFKLKSEESYTFRGPGRDPRLVCLDYVLTRQRDCREVAGFSVIDVLPGESDHLMVRVEFKSNLARAHTKPRKAPNTHNVRTQVLADPEKRKEIADALTKLMVDGELSFSQWESQLRACVKEIAEQRWPQGLGWSIGFQTSGREKSMIRREAR
jgi:hypothetical protein